MKSYLLVSGDFVRTGGMDRANYALADYLAQHGNEVHLVAHRVAEDLSSRPNVIVHRVAKPMHSYLLATPLLDRVGRYWAKRIAARGGRVLVNGGNCRWGDINWVHYVHAAYEPEAVGGLARRLKSRLSHRLFLADERKALQGAHVVITNSRRTRQDVVAKVGLPDDLVHTVYYGIDANRFRLVTLEERSRVRDALGWTIDRSIVAFVGALGDRRKGFDTLFAAVERLCGDPRWDVDFAVIGTGADLPAWKSQAAGAGLRSRVHFLGFCEDVPAILSACDALVAPTRYEAYGLAVQEALCCGVPAFVTRTAGVAEHYTAELRGLLISDPDNVTDLTERLRAWRNQAEYYQLAVATLSQKLRAFTWDDMATQIIGRIEAVE